MGIIVQYEAEYNQCKKPSRSITSFLWLFSKLVHNLRKEDSRLSNDSRLSLLSPLSSTRPLSPLKLPQTGEVQFSLRSSQQVCTRSVGCFQGSFSYTGARMGCICFTDTSAFLGSQLLGLRGMSTRNFYIFHIQICSLSQMKAFTWFHWSIALLASIILAQIRGTRVLSTKLISRLANCLIELLIYLLYHPTIIYIPGPASLRAGDQDGIKLYNQPSLRSSIIHYRIRMETRKYHRLVEVHKGELEASNLINSILSNAELQVFSKTVMGNYKAEMAKQIVAAECQSIEQIRSSSPDPPYLAFEDLKPGKGPFDTIRPYSAKVQRVRKIESTQGRIGVAANTKRTSLAKNFQSAKSLRSNKNIRAREENKSELSKYKSRLVPLGNWVQENEECDKMIEQLRKNKFKAEEYERSKELFLESIAKENQEYPKRKSKFASTMTRKEYTYSYNCQVVEIPKSKQPMKKKSNALKGSITTLAKNQNGHHPEKAQEITVEFARREPRVELKEFIFNNSEEVKTETLCPPSTFATKYKIVLQDC